MLENDYELPFKSEAENKNQEEDNRGETDQGALTCPLCGGRVLSYNWGFGCSNYRSGCKFSAGTIAKRKISEDEVKALCETGETDVLDGFVSSKTGKEFSAKLVVDKEKEAVVFKFPERAVDSSLRCPECGEPMRKFDWGYGCSGYPDCRFAVRNKIAGKDITDAQIRELLMYKKLPKITGFKSRSGSLFDAALEVVDGNVKFVFEN